MNAFQFGQFVGEKTAAGPIVPSTDPEAVLRARRVAEAKAMAAQVRGASGAPNAQGNGAHQWSGRVMPGGGVQGAQYSGPAAPAAKAPPMNNMNQMHPAAKAPAPKAPPQQPQPLPALNTKSVFSR